MGKVIMSGIVPPLVAPVTGILASELAVGSSVYLMENGVAVEYLIVNQGKPSGSSLYDDSCDGLWILRKGIIENGQWNSNNVNTIAGSSIMKTMNGYLTMYDEKVQGAIKTVKIPYCVGGGDTTINSGANGLECKLFPLSSYEVSGIIPPAVKIDGSKLDYFIEGNGADAQIKRQAFYNGSSAIYGLRSPNTDTNSYFALVGRTGSAMNFLDANQQFGIRPALILSNRAVFDAETLILKGVA